MTRYRLLPCLGTIAMLPVSSQAQEALQTSVGIDRALQQRPFALAPDDVLRAGPVEFILTPSLTLEYNDNIQYSAEDKVDDIILRPVLDVRARWPITETSLLGLGFGVGYEKYFDHAEYDSLLISPNSAITYSVTIKDLVLSLFEQASYSEDVVSAPDVVGEARFPRFENTAGLRATWTIQDWELMGGYAHYSFVGFDDRYTYLDRSSEQFFARAGYLIAPQTQAGVEFTTSLSDYTDEGETPGQPPRNDYNSYSMGPFAKWTPFEGLLVDARGGYVLYSYETGASGTSPGDVDSWYLGLTVRHQLTDFISHSLQGSHGLDVGVDNDSTERSGVGYTIRWQMTGAIDVSGGITYGHSSASPLGGLAEDYDNVGANIELGYSMTERLRALLTYNYYTRDSELPGRDYDNHIVGLKVSYRF